MSLVGIHVEQRLSRTLNRSPTKDVIVPETSSFWQETKYLLHITIPTIVIEVGFTFPGFLASSYVGRIFGYEYLSGLTLALMTGNLSTLAFLNGLFLAADTLSPQAFALGNHRQVGVIALRGFILSLVLFIIPTNLLLWCFLKDVLLALGQDEMAADNAWRWYQVYVVSLPFYALYMSTWKFLAAQAVMAPLVIVALVASVVVLPLSIHVFANAFGFLGTALAVVTFEAFQGLALVTYLWWKKPHVAETWPGLGAWREALDWESSQEYLVRTHSNADCIHANCIHADRC